MSRQFSIPTVLRMAPNALLKELFRDMGYLELDRDWEGLKEREIEPIQKAISEQPREAQGRIENELREVFELADTFGMDSILEASAMCGMADFVTQLPADVGIYQKVLWTRLQHPDVFERALRIHSFEALSWWRKRSDLLSKTINVDDALRKRLGEAISELFYDTQGRGFPCTVEHFRREDGAEYFYAHPDDFAQEATAHDENRNLTAVTIRTTFSVVFAYNSAEGSLELHAKVISKLKRRLEQIFCSVVLDYDPGDWEPSAAYDLNSLKERKFLLAHDPEDRIRVQIRAMRLSGRNTGRRTTIEISDDDDNIHDAIDEWIDTRRVPLGQVNATKVAFRFEFLELEGRKAGAETFDVAYPSSCNLKGRRPERVEIIEKYLRRWKIDVSKPVASNSGEVELDPADSLGERTAQAS